MPQVFSSQQTFNGAFRADSLSVSFAGAPLDGMVVQNIQFNFQQQVNLLYEISTSQSFVYYIGGRAQGTASVTRIVGPGSAQTALLDQFSDICVPNDLGFNGGSGCNAGAGIDYTMKDAILTSVGSTVNANDVVINETLQFMFINLEYA